MFVRAVVSRSFWGWTREIRPVSQSVTMHPSREIVSRRAAIARFVEGASSEIGYPRGPYMTWTRACLVKAYRRSEEVTYFTETA